MARSERLRASKGFVMLAVLAVIAAWIWQEALRPPATGRFEVTILSMGQGDCIFVRTPAGRTMLVDGGSEGSHDVGYNIIEPFLRREGVNRIDVLVLTHPHADHLNGLQAVLTDFRVDMVLDPSIPHPSKTYQRFLTTIRDRRIKHEKAVRGQVLDLGDGAKAEVLHPPAQLLSGTEDDVNNNSVVLRLTCGGARIMLAGDAGRDAEADIIESAGNLKCDVLKVGHHGSNDSTSDAWLDAVSPRTAVISVGKSNPFGHPRREVLERLSTRGIQVYRTDREGAISIHLQSGGCAVQGSIHSD